MKIGQEFKTLPLKEYFFYIDNYRQYADFNTLGLYRSIVEHENLSLGEKIAVREYAHQTFKKTFDFLQLKDPETFVAVQYLGQELTKADEHQIWKDIIANQQKILAGKKIKHRNFGTYSKHNCGYDTCVFNGIMIRQGTWLAERCMGFAGDKNKYQQKLKSDRRKVERKQEQQIIKTALENN